MGQWLFVVRTGNRNSHNSSGKGMGKHWKTVSRQGWACSEYLFHRKATCRRPHIVSSTSEYRRSQLRVSRSDCWLSGLYFQQSLKWSSERQHASEGCEGVQQEGETGRPAVWPDLACLLLAAFSMLPLGCRIAPQ